MMTAATTRGEMAKAGHEWPVPLMDFVDDVRRRRDPVAWAEPFKRSEPRLDALMAAVIESLAHELGQPVPDWLADVPGLREPWFVSGIESIKAICIVESPAAFRARNIFVLENFLSRV